MVFVTVAKKKFNKYRKRVKFIAPRTFVPLEGHEVGLPHYIYNKGLLRKDFKNFKIKEAKNRSKMYEQRGDKFDYNVEWKILEANQFKYEGEYPIEIKKLMNNE